MIRTKCGSELFTKWDLIDDAEKAALEKMTFGHPCTGCGEMLTTEADFARHFYVPDRRYKNVGECPVKQGKV